MKTLAAFLCNHRSLKKYIFKRKKQKQRGRKTAGEERRLSRSERRRRQGSSWQLQALRASRASAGRPHCRCRSGSGGGGGRCRSHPSRGPAAGGRGETIRVKGLRGHYSRSTFTRTTRVARKPVLKIAPLIELCLKFTFIQPCQGVVDNYCSFD